jgi:hypothetical protein
MYYSQKTPKPSLQKKNKKIKVYEQIAWDTPVWPFASFNNTTAMEG